MKLKTLLTMALLVSATIMLLPIYSAKAETLVWSGDVSSSGATLTGPVLISGRQYRIVGTYSGEWWYDYPANLQADAMYYTTIPGYMYWVNYFPAPGGHSFLQINEMDQNWGSFSNGDTGHIYSLIYVGKGEAIRFRIVDWMDGNYTNNMCHIPLSIYLVEAYYGLTPGFWKNHRDVWPSPYAPTTLLRDVFGTNAPNVNLLGALQLKGGTGLSGAKEILARSAAAALLNSVAFGAFGDGYPVPTGQLINDVTYQFNFGTRDSILSLATKLDGYNNIELSPLGWP